jgi:ribosomal protein S1
VVTGVESYGVFAEVLPGESGLVHTSELDLVRVGDARERWAVGDAIDVKLLEARDRISTFKNNHEAVLHKDRHLIVA